jgi:hypothetical protein
MRGVAVEGRLPDLIKWLSRLATAFNSHERLICNAHPLCQILAEDRSQVDLGPACCGCLVGMLLFLQNVKNRASSTCGELRVAHGRGIQREASRSNSKSSRDLSQGRSRVPDSQGGVGQVGGHLFRGERLRKRNPRCSRGVAARSHRCNGPRHLGRERSSCFVRSAECPAAAKTACGRHAWAGRRDCQDAARSAQRACSGAEPGSHGDTNRSTCTAETTRGICRSDRSTGSSRGAFTRAPSTACRSCSRASGQSLRFLAKALNSRTPFIQQFTHHKTHPGTNHGQERQRAKAA